MASEYHWTPRQVERELTDEHLVLLFDAATDRLRDRVEADFASAIEAVRAGTIFAHDGKQHARWRSSAFRHATGKDLAQLARDFGGQVTRGDFEFRN